MVMAVRLLTPLLLLMLAASCSRDRSTDPIILALGDQVVRRSDFDRHVADLESRGGSSFEPSVREALFEPFIEERLLVLEARSRGMVAAAASSEQEDTAVRRLLSEAVLTNVDVGEEEIASYFREHTAEFRVPETVTVWQILVPTPNEARDARRRLHRDPKSFEALARSRSRGPEAAAGGFMGVFSRGQLPPELEAAAFQLQAGETSDIIESSFGYHVLRVEARTPEREPSLDECRARIRTLLMRQKSDRTVRQFVSDLMARAKVNHAAAHAPARPS
jgi:parvulin-like peptidyl-prolyl isomerase